MHGFRDGFFPYEGGAVKEVFEGLKSKVQPDLVFTHHRHDLHQDHRLVCELTWNTFRDHVVLEYEVPKYDGDLGSPNLFVHLDAERVEPQGRADPRALRIPAREAVVFRGDVSLPPSSARDGEPRARNVRRGVLLPETRLVIRPV